MIKLNPEKNSIINLKMRGYKVFNVEMAHRKIKIKKDLFGILDLVGIKLERTIGVQTTSAGNFNARFKKITESENLQPLIDAGWIIELHGYDDGDLPTKPKRFYQWRKIPDES